MDDEDAESSQSSCFARQNPQEQKTASISRCNSTPMRAKELVCLLWDNCFHRECFHLSHLRVLLESCQTLLSFKPTSRVSTTKSAIIQLPRHERSNARGTKFPPHCHQPSNIIQGPRNMILGLVSHVVIFQRY